jgi:lipopolysaccharide/colanic/teichoic acid biosynthesis glycosyltransferase
VNELIALARGGAPEPIKRQLHRIVPEYVEPQLSPVLPLEAAAPVVELPGAPQPDRAATVEYDWGEMGRRVAEATMATVFLIAALPLWALMVFEARLRGQREVLTHETRIGMTRRRVQRRGARRDTAIDRRSIERRTQDLLGAPIRCARFRSDIGPISRWVASRRLDKLPFLLNVLRGEMALVGPKPEKEELVLRWSGVVPDYVRRFTVLPGVTGLAQVSLCSDSDADGVARRVQYDLYYIDHRTLLLDLRTLLRTVRVVWQSPRRLSPATNGRIAAGAAVKGVTQ